MTAGLRDGAFRAVLDRAFPLEQIVQAHEHIEQGDSRFGKIVVTVDHRSSGVGRRGGRDAAALPTPSPSPQNRAGPREQAIEWTTAPPGAVLA